jgi:hypothetical protein
MKRFDTWPERLAAFIEARRMMPFCWGKNDCALFACDAALEMTGVDLAADFRGKYHDAVGARLIMRQFIKAQWPKDCAAEVAGADYLECVSQTVGWHFELPDISTRFARRGDIALFKNANRLMLGVVDLSGCFIVGPGKNELLKAALADARRAWRV